MRLPYRLPEDLTINRSPSLLGLLVCLMWARRRKQVYHRRILAYKREAESYKTNG